MVTIYQWRLEAEMSGKEWRLEKKILETKETPKQYSVIDQGSYFFGYDRTLKKQELEAVQAAKYNGLVFSSLEDDDDVAIEKLTLFAKGQRQEKVQELKDSIAKQEQLIALLDEGLEVVAW